MKKYRVPIGTPALKARLFFAAIKRQYGLLAVKSAEGNRKKAGIMKENKYDTRSFFEAYGKMNRSQKGLEGAGEWYLLKEMLPDLTDKHVLDLGCGFGWHCRYVIENGAASVVGIDLSEKMLERAREINRLPGITYERAALEDAVFSKERFDIVFSSLALHYIKPYDTLVRDIHQWLRPGGQFVFSVEHPVFTAEGKQDWIYDKDGNILFWPVDDYFAEGKRNPVFLGENIIKYHRTLTTYLNTLIKQGFEIKEIREPVPSNSMLKGIPEMKDELRRPLMLLVAAQKQEP